MSIFDALQASALAGTIAESRWMTALLSSGHLLGFTLVMGGAMFANLRLLGRLLPDRPATELLRPATGALVVGLTLSAVTGFLMFLPRAAGAASNPTFRAKMLLLISAVAWHALVARRMARRAPEPVAAARLAGAVGLFLWVGLALAGCSFILFE